MNNQKTLNNYGTLRTFQVHPSQGLVKTLQLMNELERLSIENPSFVKFVFDNFYTHCAACIPGKIWNYMKTNFEYVADEKDENLTAPYLMLQTKKGDCDDFSLFAKTCLDIIENIASEKTGWKATYMLLGKQFGKYSHIVCFAHRGRMLFRYRDPVVIDGANEMFNYVSNAYIYRKIL